MGHDGRTARDDRATGNDRDHEAAWQDDERMRRTGRVEPDPAGVSASQPADTDSAASDDSGSAHGGGSADDAQGSDDGRPGPAHRARRTPRQQTGTGIAVLGWLAAAFLVTHRFIPDIAGLISLAETWLPWFAVPIGLLLIGAVATRTPRAGIAALAAATIWIGTYGPQLLPRGSSAVGNLRVFSEDVTGGSGIELAVAGADAVGQSASLIAIQGMDPALAASSATAGLDAAYPFHVTQYEFGIWSRYPITDPQPVDLVVSNTVAGAGTAAVSAELGDAAVTVAAPQVVVGALRVMLATPGGETELYVVHLPQAVAGQAGFAQVRDTVLAALVTTLAADRAPRLLVVGDFNTAATDRHFASLTSGLGLASAQAVAGSGFGFTWPAAFPLVRIDDVLFRGGSAQSSVVLASLGHGATHRPILVELSI